MISLSFIAPVGASTAALARRSFQPFAAVLRALSHRAEVRRLASLDDRMLRDIGLTRTDIHGALAEPLLRDPSMVLVRSVEGRRRPRRAVVAAPAAPRLRAGIAVR
jgi:uncharacterized protein YjiS (DUF1127 family)